MSAWSWVTEQGSQALGDMNHARNRKHAADTLLLLRLVVHLGKREEAISVQGDNTDSHMPMVKEAGSEKETVTFQNTKLTSLG